MCREDWQLYSQERARDDIRDVLDGLGIAKAHIVGISMGGFATLHFGFAYPERARSLVVAGCGYGAQPDKRAQFTEEVARTAAAIESQGMAEVAKTYGAGPTRVQYQNKDPRGYPSSWRSSPSIRRRARPIRSAACRPAARRCGN